MAVIRLSPRPPSTLGYGSCPDALVPIPNRRPGPKRQATLACLPETRRHRLHRRGSLRGHERHTAPNRELREPQPIRDGLLPPDRPIGQADAEGGVFAVGSRAIGCAGLQASSGLYPDHSRLGRNEPTTADSTLRCQRQRGWGEVASWLGRRRHGRPDDELLLADVHLLGGGEVDGRFSGSRLRPFLGVNL